MRGFIATLCPSTLSRSSGRRGYSPGPSRDPQPLVMPKSMPTLLRRGFLLLFLALAAPTVQAQSARPPLPAGADPNSWEAYYDLGVSVLTRDIRTAEAALYWAARLDPTRAEVPLARWVAFWLKKGDDRMFAAYMRGEPKVRNAADVARADSMRTLALRRNPFVHQGLFLLIIDAMPGYYKEDDASQGWIAYAQGNVPLAVARFGRALRQNPVKWSHLRTLRASGFVALGAYDSAQVELDAYLRHLREREAKEIGMYESKAMIEYALGLLHLQLRRPQAAEEALGRAVSEDMSFVPAHVAIGRNALGRGRREEAMRALAMGLDVDSSDVVLRMALGEAFLQQGKPDEAARHYGYVAAEEPFYAEAHYRHGTALEALGRRDDAAAAYARAVNLGARDWTNGARAAARLKAVGARP